MSKGRNFQPQSRGQSAPNSDVIQMTDEDLEAATRPETAEASSSVADNIELDPSVDGVEEEIVVPVDEEVTDAEQMHVAPESTLVPAAQPAPAQNVISGELVKNRKDALRLFKIRPRVTQRIRVPHPQGEQPMWLNLTKNEVITVPKYVRDHLFEKGML